MTAKSPQVRSPKLEYLERLVDAMQKRGATKITFGDFSVEIHPNFQPQEPDLLDPNYKAQAAREAVIEAMEKVKRANADDESDTYWST